MIGLILQSRLARWIGAAVMAVLAVLSFGALKRREGVQAERAREAVKDAKAEVETIREVSRETISDDPAADIRSRMRDRARK